MEIFALIIGAGVAVVAASPLLPGLRPAAKAIVTGSLAVVDAAKTTVAAASEQWQDIVAEAQAERNAEAAARAGTVETISIPLPKE
jgi:hypothetical protein